jgi:hypothetical protein
MTIHCFPVLFRSVFIFGIFILASCSSGKEQKEEQLRINPTEVSMADSINSISGKVNLDKIATRPNSVILTGLAEHRLITIYRFKNENKASGKYSSFYRSYNDDVESYDDDYKHFIPGLEIIYGFNLLNIAHYNLSTEKLNFFFDKPALIKSLYYPSFTQDSIDKKPINRNYYFVSVYDEDTNRDTLINKKDLRRFYHLNTDCDVKTRLIPAEYSVLRSQYDIKNDVMYLFTIFDENKNGMGDNSEPIHIFWVDLKNPQPAKKIY